MQRKGGAWIGWHGAPDEVVKPFHHDGYDIHPVPLSAQEVEEYYEGSLTRPCGRCTTTALSSQSSTVSGGTHSRRSTRGLPSKLLNRPQRAPPCGCRITSSTSYRSTCVRCDQICALDSSFTFRSRRLSFTAVCRGAKSSSRACWELTSSGSRLPELLPISSAWQGTARGHCRSWSRSYPGWPHRRHP